MKVIFVHPLLILYQERYIDMIDVINMCNRKRKK